MKNLIIISTLLCLMSNSISAQEYVKKNGVGIDFHLNQYQKDFGMGVSATSPFFLYQAVAVRLRGNLMFYEHPDENAEITWSPYTNFSLGFVGVGGWVGERIRLYGEGGVLFIQPNSSFSTTDLLNGGYGLFGFEFFMSPSFNYHIEIGAAGTGARADKIAGKPIYSNGLIVQVGFRFTFLNKEVQ